MLNIFIFRIMSDKHDNLNFECDNQGDLLLDQSEGQEEPMKQEVANLEGKQSEDPGSLLMCNDKDIFADDPLTGSQLLAFVNAPTPVDPVVPARSAETEKALQPDPNLDWVLEVKEQDSTHLEYCLVEQEEGQEDPCFSPSPVEHLHQEGSREEAEQWRTNLSIVTKFRRLRIRIPPTLSIAQWSRM